MDGQTSTRPIFLCLSLLFAVCFSIDDGGYVGTKCKNSGSPDGVCRMVYDCPAATLEKLLRRELTNCGWNDRVEIICCPMLITKSLPGDGHNRLSETDGLDDDDEVSGGRPTIRRSLQACNALNKNVLRVGINFHITEGEDAMEQEFPHMAALGYETSEGISWDCGASIISNRFLLSAAHCFIRSSPTKARIGVTWLNATDPLDMDILKITAHPEYNTSSKHNDLALVELKHNLTFSNSVFPACLYQEDDLPSALVVTGWGKTTFDNEDDRSNLLQRAIVEEVSINKCNETYFVRSLGAKTILSTQFCAYGNGSDACLGDSGGPIQIREMYAYSIVGVISYGSGCGGRVPGVYTRVSKYLDWIEKIVFR